MATREDYRTIRCPKCWSPPGVLCDRTDLYKKLDELNTNTQLWEEVAQSIELGVNHQERVDAFKQRKREQDVADAYGHKRLLDAANSVWMKGKETSMRVPHTEQITESWSITPKQLAELLNVSVYPGDSVYVTLDAAEQEVKVQLNVDRQAEEDHWAT